MINAKDDPTGALEELAAHRSGTLGVSARHLDTEEEVHFGADELLPTASVIKLPILVELMRQVFHDGRSLEARIVLREQDKCGGSGILKVFDPGLAMTVRDVATLMIVLSDNTATNLALDVVGGAGSVNSAMDRLGYRTIRLHHRVDFEVIGDDVRRLGEATPREMSALMHGIATRSVFGPEVSAAVEEVLVQQQYLDQVPRYLRVMPYATDLGLTPEISVANKTGFFTGTRVDAGIVRFRAGGGYSYAVFYHGSRDTTFLPEAEGNVLAGLVGKALTTHWWPGDQASAVVATAYDTVGVPAGS